MPNMEHIRAGDPVIVLERDRTDITARESTVHKVGTKLIHVLRPNTTHTATDTFRRSDGQATTGGYGWTSTITTPELYAQDQEAAGLSTLLRQRGIELGRTAPEDPETRRRLLAALDGPPAHVQEAAHRLGLYADQAAGITPGPEPVLNNPEAVFHPLYLADVRALITYAITGL